LPLLLQIVNRQTLRGDHQFSEDGVLLGEDKNFNGLVPSPFMCEWRVSSFKHVFQFFIFSLAFLISEKRRVPSCHQLHQNAPPNF
jgi:hypothetical protein